MHGVDFSATMLQGAKDKHVYAQLHEADVTNCPLASQTYDLGITGLAACHLPDLQRFYSEAARLLRPGGFFILLDYHPFFLLQGIPTHFTTTAGEPIAITNFVHLLSEHINSGRNANWTLLEMHERLIDAEWSAARPGMARYLHQPVSFVMVWKAP